MDDWLIYVIVYFIIGIIANRVYAKKDARYTEIVELKIKNYVSSQTEHDYLAYKMHQSIAQKSIDYAGWCYWRRKKPFDKMPIWIKNVIALPFWPIDNLLCEIGYMREFKYIKDHCLDEPGKDD